MVSLWAKSPEAMSTPTKTLTKLNVNVRIFCLDFMGERLAR